MVPLRQRVQWRGRRSCERRDRGSLRRLDPFGRPPGNGRSWRKARVAPSTTFWRIAPLRRAGRSEDVRPRPKFPADCRAAAADAQRKFIGDRVSKHDANAVMPAHDAGLARCPSYRTFAPPLRRPTSCASSTGSMNPDWAVWRETPARASFGEILRLALSARLIGCSTPMQRCGCAGGCAPGTRSGDAGAEAIHPHTSTGASGSYV
jgi:hypothetical protein